MSTNTVSAVDTARAKVTAIRAVLETVTNELDSTARAMRDAALDPDAFAPLAERRASLAARHAALLDALAEAEADLSAAVSDHETAELAALRAHSADLSQRIADADDAFRVLVQFKLLELHDDARKVAALVAEKNEADRRAAALSGERMFTAMGHPTEMPAHYVAGLARLLAV